MTKTRQRKMQRELLSYKYLCLFVLGFLIGIFLGTAL
jgi:hypothetical protein